MKNKFQKGLRVILLSLGVVVAVLLFQGWMTQSRAPLTCSVAFGTLDEHNGYLELRVLGEHTHEMYFEGQLFTYYPNSQSPPNKLSITRGTSGTYAPSILDTDLVPFSLGRATRNLLPVSLPTPGISTRQFPFDSPTFDLKFTINPALRPKVIRIRNTSPDFILDCDTLKSDWKDSGELSIAFQLQRNPFVQYSTVIIGIAALLFGLLLGAIKAPETLSVATGSFFFSMWSIRAIVSPANLLYSTLFDFWLMAVSVLVLFIVGWRLIGLIERTPGRHGK
jgi:hypothetical protein